MSLTEWLTLDYQAFFWINRYATHPLLDTVMPFLRDQYFWSPLYLFIIVYLFFHYPRRTAWLMLGGVLLVVLLSDQISSSLIKPYFERLHPCRDPDFTQYVHLLIPCGSGKSFVSSHAANHFAVATYFSVLFQSFRLTFLAFLWASIVAYGQVYVGVHYPSDVLFGSLLGIGIGAIIVLLVKSFLAR